MGLIFGIFGAILAGLGLAKKSAEASSLSKTSKPMKSMYNVKSWAALAAKMAGDIPVPFILEWIRIESGGNPCKTGGSVIDLKKYPKANPKDVGIVVESGIGQLYYPDDFNRFGIDIDKWRAPCQGGKYSTSSVCLRPLTGEELNAQMDGLIKYINRLRMIVSQTLIPLGIKWGVSTSDYWTAVKLYHGVPNLFKKAFPDGTKKLGYPPRSWKELRGAIDKLNVANWISNGRGSFYTPQRISEVLSNAERTGRVVGRSITNV